MRKHIRRRRLSMTSLIDVIFLLLLFFMLSSTFSKFGEVRLDAGGAGSAGPVPERLALLRLDADTLDLNGTPLTLAQLAQRLDALDNPTLAVTVRPAASAQRLTDLLVALRARPDVPVILLGDG